MSDLLDRYVAVDDLKSKDPSQVWDTADVGVWVNPLPSAQPEITDEQAIEHLQKSGWMQNHDKQMYEMGLREQLADDSGSYDALLPSVQPTIEPRKGRWIYNQKRGTMKIWTCSECGWNDIGEFNFCSNCGADMREEKDDG